MADQSTDSNSLVRGLVTVAMLKAYYDDSKDYFEMFMPFVEGAISSLKSKRFTRDQVRSKLIEEYGLQVPNIALSQMVNRFKRRNDVVKEGGCYIIKSEINYVDLKPVRESASVKLRTLSKALKEFAAKKEINYKDSEDAASALFGFFEQYHSDVLLRNGSSQTQGNVNRETKVLSRFIYDECQTNRDLYDCLNTVVIGYTLQDALTLRNIATPPKEFEGLQVFFDSGFLFGLLGYEGEAHERAFTETTQLLERTGARLRCFETTVDEMKRILDVYRRKLRTPKGRSELYQTPLTRYFLSSNSTSSDVEQIMALLETSLNDKGIRIQQRPERNERHTLDEDSLYESLSSEDSGENDDRKQISHRVDHDVDCTAAILTLRRGERPPNLDSATAVFASTSKHTVATIGDWYEKQNAGSLPPALTVTEVSNQAWLKRPYAATDLKMNELVALCYAALRPSDEAWSKFKRRLEAMVESGEINSDERAAIVASSFTDRFLSEAEEEADLDESSLDEVVYTVKRQYQQEAEERIQKVRKNAKSEIAELEKEVRDIREDRERQATDATEQKKKLDRLIELIASGVADVLYYVTGLIVVFGLYAGLPESVRIGDYNVPYANSIFSGLAFTVVFVLTFTNLLNGLNITILRKHCRRKVSALIKEAVNQKP